MASNVLWELLNVHLIETKQKVTPDFPLSIMKKASLDSLFLKLKSGQIEATISQRKMMKILTIQTEFLICSPRSIEILRQT